MTGIPTENSWSWETKELIHDREPSVANIAAKLWSSQEARKAHMPLLLKQYLAERLEEFERALAQGPFQDGPSPRELREGGTAR